MKSKMLLRKLLLIFTFVTYHSLFFSQPGLTEIKNFGTNPGKLTFFIHTPKIIGVKMPLVVALHGCNQDVATIAVQSGWNKLADTYGFYVIYPQQRFLNNASSCFNWFNEKDITKDKGEVGSIKQMIDLVCDSFSIDTSKIFAYGLSAGAAMRVALLADYPGTFNAGAILAGGPFMMATNPISGLTVMITSKNKSSKAWGDLVKQQNPDYKSNYPRLIIIHGKNDKIVNIKNAYALVKQWANLVNADTLPSKKTAMFANNKDIEKKYFCDKQNEEKIIFYEVNKLGHALMVDPGDGIDKGGQKDLFAVDKDFFSTYWIAKDFGVIK